MKKIALFAALVFLSSGVLFAQKAVNEQDVKVNYIKDFQRQAKDATDIQWWQIDDNTFKVTFLDEEKSRQAMVFSNKGMEVHYIIDDSKYYPKAIVDYIKANFSGYDIKEFWVRKARNKMTYQARISKTSGFIFWKKESDPRVLSFETDGKFIDE